MSEQPVVIVPQFTRGQLVRLKATPGVLGFFAGYHPERAGWGTVIWAAGGVRDIGPLDRWEAIDDAD